MKKLFILFCLGLWPVIPTFGQYVAVTIQLDNPSISVGATTKLHVFAQVIPAQRTNAERVFSWYVDFINETPTVAQAEYANLLRPVSDQNSQTSSSGTADGANRRGIYDTFINDSPTTKSGFGVNTPVELFSVPIKALDAGQARFRVDVGTGVASLGADFIVAPKAGGDPLLGGVYDAASAALTTLESAGCSTTLLASFTRLGPGQNKVTLTFTPCPGRNQSVEFSDKIFPATWVSLPNGPHNSGTASDTNAVTMRFYRVRVD